MFRAPHGRVLVLAVLGLNGLGGQGALAGPEPIHPVQSALRSGSFPWYDAQADSVRALKVPPQPEELLNKLPETDLRWTWGEYLVFGLFVAALVGFVVLVARYWKKFEPAPDAGVRPDASARVAGSGMELPAVLREAGATDDPWAEADRRRLAGDLAGATICLFMHQLLTLSRLSLIRLGPGRTARQLHRTVSDPEFQALMGPTLRLFEAAYYGHQSPTASEFAAVWESAGMFERRARRQDAR